MSGRKCLLAAVAVAAVAAIAAAVARRQPDWSLAGPERGQLLVETLGALALAAAGLVVSRRGPGPRSGPLFIAAAAAWLSAEWNNPGALGPIVFTIGLLLGEAAAAMIAHALLVHGHRRLRTRPQVAVVVSAYAGVVLIGGLGAALWTDPPAHGCGTCPSNLLRVANDAAMADDLQRWGLRLGTVGLILAAGLLVHSTWQTSAARRRAIAPVVLAGLLYLVIVIVRYIDAWATGWPGNGTTQRALRLAEACAFLAIAVGVAWQRLAARRMRHRLARIVVQVAQTPKPGQLRDLLANAIGDLSLELLYAVEGKWVDSVGATRSVPDAKDRTMTSLVQDGSVVAVVLHQPGVMDDRRLVEELGNAAGLALQHDRLQAQLLSQLKLLRQSRTMAVTAADRERYQLERDLHDGAQQGLAALAIAIGVERAAEDAARTTELAMAQDAIRSALDEVRRIAHGLYPAALADAGLAAAIDVLKEWSPNLESGTVSEERFSTAVESTAYFVVAALARATTSPVTASIALHDGRLFLDVETLTAPDVAELEDRVGALDGWLQITQARGGEQLVRAELPCA